MANMFAMAARPDQSGTRPFVGRVRELAVATAMLGDTDRAGVALIGGESGLGKTRLVEEIIAASPEGTTVVRGGAVPRQTPIPFELIRSAVGPLDETSALPGDTDQPPLADHVLAAAEALRSLHHESTIFVFEDVHWADAESLEVIDRLMVTGPLRASLLVTYRPNALRPGHLTSSFLQRAERRSHVAQLRLEPLRHEEVGDYLQGAGRAADARTVEHVHNRTGGNPLLLSELVAATDTDADLTSGLPWTLAEMLRPEIERLPDNERRVAEAVAVLGVDVDFELVAAAVNSSDDQLLTNLRSLVDLGILIESGPDRFGFRHDLVREAVADSLFTREHRRVHAAVHDALLASGSQDVVALVAHATGAGRTKQAADAARDGAHAALASGRTHQAMALAEQALLVHIDDIGLLRVAVVAGWMIGQDRAALDHLDQWEELVGSGPSDRVEVLHHRVRLFWEQGDVDLAERAAEELASVIELLEPSTAQAQALADLAQHYMLSGRGEEAMAVAGRALEVAELVGPAASGAARQARAERASARLWNGAELEGAVDELLAIASDAEGVGDYVVASRALHNTPVQAPALEPRSHIERMRRASQKAGFSCIATDGYRLALLAVAEIEGDRESYQTVLAAALEDLPDTTEVQIDALLLAVDDGRIEDVHLLADRLAVASDPIRHSPARRRGALAMAQLEEGDAEAARRWLREAVPDVAALQILLRFFSPILAAGLASEVHDLLARAGSYSPIDSACSAIEPAYAGIEAEMLEGDPAAAEALYAAALESGVRRSAIDEAEIHLARARVARSLRLDDRSHLEEAGRKLAHWPGRRQELVASLLGEPCCDDTPSLLTPREREVAALVARGLTNGGIADELFISTKTASVHVSNILAKLNMSSRTEIAVWVTGGGLD